MFAGYVGKDPAKSIVYALRHAIQQHEHSMAERDAKADDSIINFMGVRM